jgi:murein DD-endopeptidase MepM/ murein hydrolase activator NlpD
VKVRHSNDRETVYAHLSRIDVKRGQHVEQGMHIANVGMTGWATGPHLHFEFKLKGQQQDPLVVAKTSEAIVLTASAQQELAKVTGTWREQLKGAASLASYTGDAE